MILLSAQYLANPSLSVDEISVALNLRAYSLGRLLTAPLDYAQVAPAGWLVLEKVVGSVGAYTEVGLRFVPFVMAVAALVLMRRVGVRVAGEAATALALVWLATSLLFLQFATAVKQYSTDLAAVLVLTLLALDLVVPERELSRWRVLAYGAAGAVALVLSQAAVFAVAGVVGAFALAAIPRRDRPLVTRAAPALGIWLAVAGLVTLLSLRNTTPGLMAYMDRFWGGSFVPFPPSSADDVRTIWTLFRDSFLGEIAYMNTRHFPKLLVALLAVGIVAMARRRWVVLAILVGPIAATFAASALHRYPFGGRVALFLHPAILLLIAYGADTLRRMMPRRVWAIGAVAMALLLVPRVRMLASQLPPYWMHHPRPLFAELSRLTRPGDVVYLHHTADKPYRYYGNRVDLRDRRIVHGSCAVGTPKQYMFELDSLRGAPRAWVVLVGPQFGEEPLIRYYLAAMGTVRDSVAVGSRLPGGLSSRSVAWQYDLSDATRLATIRADTVTIAPFMHRPEFGWMCYGFTATGQDHPSLWR